MLSNLLPGLRHVRTPLTAGYLYLLLIWLIFGERLVPQPSSPGAAGDLADLAGLLRPAATAAGLSFFAYLIGSIAMVRRWPTRISPTESKDHGDYSTQRPSGDWAWGFLGWTREAGERLHGRVTNRAILEETQMPSDFRSALERAWRSNRDVQWSKLVDDVNEWAIFSGQDWDESDLDRSPIPRDAWTRTEDRWGVKKTGSSGYWDWEQHLDSLVDGEVVTSALMMVADDEVERATARLRVESDAVFNEYDRMRSEAELRYTIVLPLAGIVFMFATTWHWWAIFGLALPCVLLVAAYLTERSSVGYVLSAIQYGVVKSPTVEALNALLATGPAVIDGGSP